MDENRYGGYVTYEYAAALKAELERVRKYAKHTPLCAVTGGYEYPCNCGLESPHAP